MARQDRWRQDLSRRAPRARRCAARRDGRGDGLREGAVSEQQPNSRLDTIRPALDELRRAGWEPGLTPESYDRIAQVGFYRKTLPLAFVATEILATEQPMTLRGLFYRVVSAGWLPSTERRHYDQLGRIMVRLREAGVVPFAWLV